MSWRLTYQFYALKNILVASWQLIQTMICFLLSLMHIFDLFSAKPGPRHMFKEIGRGTKMKHKEYYIYCIWPLR